MSLAAENGCVPVKLFTKTGSEGVFGPRKENKCQKPLLNHLTSEKTKLNFRSRPDAPGQL